MSFTAKKKRKKQGQVHQTNAVKAESNWPQPIFVCQNSSALEPTFSKFFVKNITTNTSYQFFAEILRNPPPKNSSKVHRDEGKNGRRNTTTTTKKNTNVIIIVYAAFLNFFFDKFRV